jgi:4-amino-4-deoxy-L-arabinose transferase-like glycosyltransferase
VPATPRPRPWLAWAIVAAAVLAAALIRLRLLDVPLDRDEGEYAYMGRLLLEGSPPYARAWNMKYPGIYMVYALILGAFGVSAAAVRIGVMVATSLSTVLVFRLGGTLAGPSVGAAAAATFATLALSPAFLGHAGNAEHFVLPPALAGVLIVLGARERRDLWRFATAGVLLGGAALVKQHGACFLLFALVFLLLARRVRETAAVLAGAAVPAAAVLAWLAAAGVFPRFWFWTVSYASRYATLQSPTEAVLSLAYTIGVAGPSILGIAALAGAGLAAVATGPRAPELARPLVLLTAAALAAACVGLYFRQQYFLLLTPALALLAALGADHVAGRTRRSLGRRGAAAVAAAAVVLALLQSLWSDRQVLFQFAPAAIARAIYGANPFPEAIAVAEYVRRHTAPGERIAVIGSEPEIYFHAGRAGATGYIYAYPLMEDQPYALRMQQEMVQELEAASPRFFVYVNVPYSWLRTDASPRYLTDWFARLRDDRLEQVGLVDMLSASLSMAFWDERARGARPQSPLWIAVYRRRDPAIPAAGVSSAVTGGPVQGR